MILALAYLSIACLCAIFVADIVIFYKCKTYRSATSLLISTCLVIDLGVRIS